VGYNTDAIMAAIDEEQRYLLRANYIAARPDGVQCSICGRIMPKVWHEDTKIFRRECLVHPLSDGVPVQQMELPLSSVKEYIV